MGHPSLEHEQENSSGAEVVREHTWQMFAIHMHTNGGGQICGSGINFRTHFEEELGS